MILPDQQMSEEEYNKLPGIRSTALKYYLKYGARAYFQKYEACEFAPETDKPAFQIGRLFHACILEDLKLWADPFDGDKRTKAYKEYKAECELEGLEPIGAEDDRKLKLMRKSFEANPVAMDLLERAVRREQTLTFDYAGLDCKVRLDMWLDSDAIVDLKTCRNASSEKFFYQGINDFGYHYSAAFYEMAVQSYLETDRDIPYLFIAVENCEPFRCAIHTMHDDVMNVARRDVRQALKDIAKCRESGEWPEPLAEQIQTYVPGMKWLADNDALAEAI